MPHRVRKSAVVALALGAALVACDDPAPKGPGSILVNSTVAPLEPTSSFFQYAIAVDSGTPRTLSVFDNVIFIVNGLAPGGHLVELLDVPSTCSAGQAGSRRPVDVQGDTAIVMFNITCARTTADLRVNVTTTGPEPDPNGYSILFDGFSVGFLPPNGGVTLQFAPTGSHTVSLSDVAPNCTPPAAQTTVFTAGQLTTVNFTVTCAQGATVRVISTGTGADVDPDGALVKIGAAAPIRVASGTSFIRVPAGTQTWELSDIQANCTVAATTGSFTAAANDTVTIDATATCTDVGYGVAGTVSADPAGDTLANTSSPVQGHDVIQTTTRYTNDFLILVLRFTRPTVPGVATAQGLGGYIDLDTDENVSTGDDPIINSFGGSAQQGVDWYMLLFTATATSVPIERISSTNDSTTHRVPLRAEGDSIIIKIPFAKIADDGRMTISMVLGTELRPTDIAPNSGQIVARPATPLRAGIIAGAQAPREGRVIKRDVRTWGPPAPKPLVVPMP